MAGWIKQPKKSEPASPVAVLDEQPILNEAESRSLFKRQIEARLAKAQQVLAKRHEAAAKIEAERLAEEREAVEAAAELARIEAEEAAEASRVEAERLDGLMAEYRAKYLSKLRDEAVAHHNRIRSGDLLDEARLVFEEMFRVPAPDRALWKQDGPYFACEVFERATLQMVVHPISAEAGESEWVVSLSGEFPNGVGGIQIADRRVLGRYLIEYPEIASFLGQFGLSVSDDEAVLLDAPGGV